MAGYIQDSGQLAPVLLLLRCVELPCYRGFHLVELDKAVSYFRLNFVVLS